MNMHSPATKPARQATTAMVQRRMAARLVSVTMLLAAVGGLSGCNAIFNIIVGPDPDPHPTVPPQQPIADQPDVPPSFNQPDAAPDAWTPPNNNTNPDINPNNYPKIHGVYVIANATNKQAVVRIRPIRPGVHVDCNLLLKSPELALSTQLFGMAQTWLVGPSRSIPVNRPPWAKTGCGAVLVDGGGLPRRLVVWQGSHKALQHASVVTKFGSKAEIRIVPDEGGLQWQPHPGLHPAPLEVHPPVPKQCVQPDSSVGVAWTEPLPAGDVTIVDIAEAPDGCRMMDLFGDKGVMTWVLCTPPGSFPYKLGDSFFVTALKHGHDLGTLKGVEILGKGFRLRAGIGSDVVYFGKGKATVQDVAGCGLTPADCGSLQRALEVEVTRENGEKATLRAGGKLEIAKGRTLHLMRARRTPVVDTACIEGATSTTKQVESVYVEVK